MRLCCLLVFILLFLITFRFDACFWGPVRILSTLGVEWSPRSIRLASPRKYTGTCSAPRWLLHRVDPFGVTPPAPAAELQKQSKPEQALTVPDSRESSCIISLCITINGSTISSFYCKGISNLQYSQEALIHDWRSCHCESVSKVVNRYILHYTAQQSARNHYLEIIRHGQRMNTY